jgi:RasGEF domain
VFSKSAPAPLLASTDLKRRASADGPSGTTAFKARTKSVKFIPLKGRRAKEKVRQKAGGGSSSGADSPSPREPPPLHSFTFFDIPPLEVARQITVVDDEAFKAIMPHELLTYVRKTKEDAPNVRALIARFNYTTRWVATQVLSQKQVVRRGLVLSRLIIIAEELRALNNLSACMGRQSCPLSSLPRLVGTLFCLLLVHALLGTCGARSFGHFSCTHTTLPSHTLSISNTNSPASRTLTPLQLTRPPLEFARLSLALAHMSACPRAHSCTLMFTISVCSCARARSLSPTHNTHTLAAFVGALQSSAIHRLKRTWTLLPGETLEYWDRLLELVRPDGSFTIMRSYLSKVNPPLIPHLGMYLSDLTFIEDGNPDFLFYRDDTTHNTDLVNILKLRRISNVVGEWAMFQQKPYHFAPVLRYQMLLLDQGVMDSKEMYAKSLRLEPRAPPKPVLIGVNKSLSPRRRVIPRAGN